MQPIFAVFQGTSLLTRGTLNDILTVLLRLFPNDQLPQAALSFFDQEGAALDLDLRGSRETILEAAKKHPVLGSKLAQPAESEEKRSAGRPKIGVVGREVSLLPRHWEWLQAQTGNISATLRKLVEQAMRANEEKDRERIARENCHRFLWHIAGNLPNFEDVSRAIFAGDEQTFSRATESWPIDIVAYALLLLHPEKKAGGN